jgi:DNA-binding transcriptional LysR family regulator
MKPSIESIETFSLVAKLGSFSKTASHLCVSKSLVSRRISDLESKLGARLLSRSSNFVELTPLGQKFSQKAQKILAEYNAAIEFVNSEMSVSKGNIFIHTTTKFGTMFAYPAINEFMEANLDINVGIDLDDNGRPCVPEGADFSIRIGKPEDSDLTIRFFKSIPLSLICSPSVARKLGSSFSHQDVKNCECIVFKDTKSHVEWAFTDTTETTRYRPSGRLVSNNWEIVLSAAIEGRGIALVPQFIARAAIEKGQLVELCHSTQIQPLDLYALFPTRAIMSSRVRLLVDFLALKWKKPFVRPSCQHKHSQTEDVNIANNYKTLSGTNYQSKGSPIKNGALSKPFQD